MKDSILNLDLFRIICRGKMHHWYDTFLNSHIRIPLNTSRRAQLIMGMPIGFSFIFKLTKKKNSFARFSGNTMSTKREGCKWEEKMRMAAFWLKSVWFIPKRIKWKKKYYCGVSHNITSHHPLCVYLCVWPILYFIYAITQYTSVYENA